MDRVVRPPGAPVEPFIQFIARTATLPRRCGLGGRTRAGRGAPATLLSAPTGPETHNPGPTGGRCASAPWDKPETSLSQHARNAPIRWDGPRTCHPCLPRWRRFAPDLGQGETSGRPRTAGPRQVCRKRISGGCSTASGSARGS
ncbi:hypothetical protein GCM10010505_06670 [Kitasatospora aburaviensis]